MPNHQQKFNLVIVFAVIIMTVSAIVVGRTWAQNSVKTIAASPAQCHLFPGGIQDTETKAIAVVGLAPVELECRSTPNSVPAQSPGMKSWIATRKMKVQGTSYLLLTDLANLHSEIDREDCFRCQPVKKDRLIESVQRISSPPQKPEEKSKQEFFADAGLRKSEIAIKGSIITSDLCPSQKPLDRSFYTDLEKLETPVPIAISVAGTWLNAHEDDFLWLKSQVASGRLDVTWVNHSYRHPFDPDAEDEDTFLRTPGVQMDREILRTETLLISRGVTPSVYFRFPGLISDSKLLQGLISFNLINLGTNAWLAKGQNPQNGSVVLVHANGNEPEGIDRFRKLVVSKKLPLPLLPLSSAVSP